ncbi:hypothetical protein BFP97_12810 [Roseivirga sp. 4D4]|uniref:hypothetical protein n=1 Tax=Roseivirga sp. 4D4 TaxID=1889784 RepID=UPI000853A8B9|nr:hypothetical protein [Roseivirga sp. 4D4]OEK02347.1 hypothetical protein BFP97_12810 [Roseivirga sp. 4D4]
MKRVAFFCIIILSFTACTSGSDEIDKEWLGRPVDFASIREVTNTYHMFNADGDKMGSMIFGTFFEDGQLVARDTSQFDDGSVYEEAEFRFDTTSFTMQSTFIDMKTSNSQFVTKLTMEGSSVKGQAEIRANDSTRVVPIDQSLGYDIVRSELYMLIQTLSIEAEDTLKFKALVPSSLRLSEASLTYDSSESIHTEVGVFDCDVLILNTDGNMPSNKIWVSRESPRQIVNFEVPGAALVIQLVAQRSSKE